MTSRRRAQPTPVINEDFGDREATVCDKCGAVHEKTSRSGQTFITCVAHKVDGSFCPNWPVKGTTVCAQSHGGRAPNTKAKAVERVEARSARTMLARLGQPEPIGHPVFELIELASEVKAWQQILRERVGELSKMNTVDTLGTERERAVVLLYERALDRSTKILVDMAKLDLQARALVISQKAASELMIAALETLRRCGLEDREIEFRQTFAAVVREMQDQQPASIAAAVKQPLPAMYPRPAAFAQ